MYISYRYIEHPYPGGKMPSQGEDLAGLKVGKVDLGKTCGVLGSYDIGVKCMCSVVVYSRLKNCTPQMVGFRDWGFPYEKPPRKINNTM